jgi:hypothetical protein
MTDIKEIFFSLEDGKPTLWDADYPGGGKPPVHAIRAVYLTNSDGHVLITTDPEIVTEHLDG